MKISVKARPRTRVLSTKLAVWLQPRPWPPPSITNQTAWPSTRTTVVNLNRKATEAARAVALITTMGPIVALLSRASTKYLPISHLTASSCLRLTRSAPGGRSLTQRSCSAANFAVAICHGRPGATRKTASTYGSPATQHRTWTANTTRHGSTSVSRVCLRARCSPLLSRISAIK